MLSDGGFGEGHSKVVVFAEVVIVELDQALDGLVHGTHLDERHLVVFLEELESLDQVTGAVEEHLQIILHH